MKSRSPSKVSQCYLTQDKLKIIIRIRPILNEEDPEQFVKLEDDHTIQIRRPGNHSYMKFNNILSAESKQKDVFSLVEDSIRQFLSGINITIFAYGQTGAGKTYSMIGNYSPHDSRENLFNFLSSKERGILSRSLEVIMNSLREATSITRVYVSFFEIYNEKIYDLYNNTMMPLDIRESKNGEISIPDLSNIQVTNMEEAIQYLMIGLKNRATGSTHANAKSSRSHSIFQISLEKEDDDGSILSSSLRIVDLAGSQKFKIPSDLSPIEKETRIQELTSINGSLSCLGHCISALIQKSRTHIPFRNSKLTRILSDSLIGQGKMRFIICISPSTSASAETFSTLQFANRAKKAIFQRNQMKSPHLNKKKSENQQITSLRKELEKEREQRLIIEKELSKENHTQVERIMKENCFLKKENQQLKQKVKQLMIECSRKNQSNNGYSRKRKEINHEEGNKENSQMDFKEQMLKLPIFQNCPVQKKENHEKSAHKKSTQSGNHQKSSVSVNKRRAQFEKKIKRFIEADSPCQAQHKSHKGIREEYSFHRGQKENKELKEDWEEWTQNEDTQQIIQGACEKMNIPDFKDLRSEMERARFELLALKKKDDEISRMKPSS